MGAKAMSAELHLHFDAFPPGGGPGQYRGR